MRVDILTLFPEMFNILNQSIIGRAVEKGIIQINTVNIRDFSDDKHNRVDDTPYGGGAGMVMRPDYVYNAYKSIVGNDVLDVPHKKPKVIYMSPQGKTLTQKMAERISKEEHIIILCGHYEGIDERVLEEIVDEEISIGDYILTGGEMPAMILVDTVSRLIDGVLSKDSISEETFTNGLLEYPQYTRPVEFMGKKVPDVLTSGNHEKIREWRNEQSLIRTKNKRPDLLNKED